MALRLIRFDDDPILRKPTREIKDITPRIRTLAQDMLDTMYEAEGVGLAAPQVGVLRKMFVLDVGEGPMVMINPKILSQEGEETLDEACLSFPGKSGKVTRPTEIVAEYTNLDGERKTVKATGLFARCICHENDHLDGIVYLEHVLPGTLSEDSFEDLDGLEGEGTTHE